MFMGTGLGDGFLFSPRRKSARHCVGKPYVEAAASDAYTHTSRTVRRLGSGFQRQLNDKRTFRNDLNAIGFSVNKKGFAVHIGTRSYVVVV
ncbi:hypothetical protein AVEN_214827-1 [Araneus ventricosus]|uniref:Uncharacterized protein n=1 Tax=Araneus ventricosus TaxID=182803 RepID=A0A4Y2X036_ARAVE|nr:hypothetical protein AVEN_214827-1 [Araneus ventricosus]